MTGGVATARKVSTVDLMFPEMNKCLLNSTELRIMYIMLTLLHGMADKASAINLMITMG